MKEKKLQYLAVLAAALLIAIGATSLAIAQSPQSTTPSTTAAEAENDGVVHEFEGEEVGENGDGIPDADEATEAEEGTEAEEADEAGDAEEAIPADAASITEDQAIAAASNKAGGTVKSVSLDDEDGTIVYEVDYDDGTEVAVDANTGDVLKVEAAGAGD